MRFRTVSVLTVAVLAAVSPCDAEPAKAFAAGGIRVRVDLLKKTIEDQAGDGPVLLGAQAALELEWRVLNQTGATLNLPSPDAVLRLRASENGRQMSVRTDWAADMTVRSTVNGNAVSSTLPLGSAALPDGSSLSVRGSTKLADGSAFAPGDYVLALDVKNPQPDSSAGAQPATAVDAGFPIKLHIRELDSPDRQRRFHLIEAGFYRKNDSDRALKHYLALASMPEARWTDSLPLAQMYGELGRYRESSVVFRRLLPDLMRALDTPFGNTLRDGRYLAEAARSFAAEGDVAGAANLLRLEGRTPEARINAVVEELRKSAVKPNESPKP